MKFEVPPDFVPINIVSIYVVLLVTPFFNLKNHFRKEVKKKRSEMPSTIGNKDNKPKKQDLNHYFSNF